MLGLISYLSSNYSMLLMAVLNESPLDQAIRPNVIDSVAGGNAGKTNEEEYHNVTNLPRHLWEHFQASTVIFYRSINDEEYYAAKERWRKVISIDDHTSRKAKTKLVIEGITYNVDEQ